MLTKLFGRTRKSLAPARPEISPGVRVWAIGDIHGRLDLLEPLVDAVRSDLEGSDAKRKVCIFLGDYIDRGPASCEVIRFLADLDRTGPIEWRFLKGNHEETMLDFLDDPSVGPAWCTYGGDTTLRSYGLRPPAVKHVAGGWASVSQDLAHNLSPKELGFLEGLELSVEIGGYFFAHAGARPGTPLQKQRPHDLMWIRRSFLDSDVPLEKIVVHGHTPTTDVYADPRRIGIDTKAYESGVLTALGLWTDERRLLKAVASDDGVDIRREDLA